jgi:hypothetical protein
MLGGYVETGKLEQKSRNCLENQNLDKPIVSGETTMRANNRPQPCDVTVYSDKGSLALRFPKRHNPLTAPLKRGGFLLAKSND